MGGKQGYRRGKSMRATWHRGVYWVSKFPMTTKSIEQLVTLNPERCSQFGVWDGEVNSTKGCGLSAHSDKINIKIQNAIEKIIGLWYN